MNVDIICRASQKVLVCTDMFSASTTAVIVPAETREALEHGLVQVITPIRHSPSILVRADKAPAFKSLAKNLSPILKENGIVLELVHDANKNSNAVVDKVIQELELELKKLSPEGVKLSVGRLGHAVTILNNRVRSHGLTASELHFSRDPVRGVNLHLTDSDLSQEKNLSR